MVSGPPTYLRVRKVGKKCRCRSFWTNVLQHCGNDLTNVGVRVCNTHSFLNPVTQSEGQLSTMVNYQHLNLRYILYICGQQST